MPNTPRTDPSAVETVSRRRGAELEDAILDAAREELAELGYAKSTMSGIANRAGTSKPVLYRRWSSLPELVLDTLGSRFANVPVPDTGDLRDDVLTLLRQAQANLADTRRDTVSGLIADTVHDARLTQRLRDLIAGSTLSDAMATVLERAAERGQIPPGRRPRRVITLPISLLRDDFVVFGIRPSDADLAAVTDEVFLPLLGYAPPSSVVRNRDRPSSEHRE
ncbi:TetR/AcrR family transcriptional regulator [Nonomuraea longispora]|uniref:TetR/AcrR family transcriptional regulator n=1 Tax=Nonomuraea longispora TaxID=1848320 RepID=A0A4R4NJU5_9ACTN|nr:TetR/AcrR family transcriptional regulator [Nonomuraea longispora]TDC07212.1 TetR/AcrR family transcriptional regulator [Nonomuraea longispora]